MSKQLIKQPNMIAFWLVLASGLAVVLIAQGDAAAGGTLSKVARTFFWCSVVAYFSVRIYQYAMGRHKAAEAEPGADEHISDDV